MHHLDTAWEALQAAYRGSPSQEDVKDLHVSTTRHANDLVAEMRAAHARKMGPQGMQTALMVDLYQRQTMLSQSIIHQICRIYLQGEGDDSAQKALKETLPVFEGSLQAFISGLPSAGVAPPQDAALRGTLMDAARIWQDVAPLATQIANDNAVNRADVLTVLSRTETFLPYMVEAAELLRVPKERS